MYLHVTYILDLISWFHWTGIYFFLSQLYRIFALNFSAVKGLMLVGHFSGAYQADWIFCWRQRCKCYSHLFTTENKQMKLKIPLYIKFYKCSQRYSRFLISQKFFQDLFLLPFSMYWIKGDEAQSQNRSFNQRCPCGGKLPLVHF